jgi:hypothetical protein
MITILVDEGYAYDYLSILNVKHKKNNNEKSITDRNLCEEHLLSQVGEYRHLEIINSKEFQNLVDVNLTTFEAVEKARYGEISAKEVDDLNMKRYHYKITLQNKFFPSTKVTEFKS